MPDRFHSSLLLVAVFVLGLAGGVGVMVWAWPGVRNHFHHEHQGFMDFLQHSLDLSPEQMPKVREVFNDAHERGSQVHAQFVPAYTRICDEYMDVLGRERAAFAPIRQQEMDRMQSVLTPKQWTDFSAQASKVQREREHYRPDVCRHLENQRNHNAQPPATAKPSAAQPATTKP